MTSFSTCSAVAPGYVVATTAFLIVKFGYSSRPKSKYDAKPPISKTTVKKTNSALCFKVYSITDIGQNLRIHNGHRGVFDQTPAARRHNEIPRRNAV